MTEPKRLDLSASEADALLGRLAEGQLKPGDHELLGTMVKSWLWLSGVVQDAKISIRELKKLIFGAKTEKTRKVVKQNATGKQTSKDAMQKRPKGHGRNGTDAYTGAERICLKCTQVRRGDRCPECGKGKLYAYRPGEIVCIRGQAPLHATVYEQEKLRCNLCGVSFKASMPPDATGPKYDASAGSMMASLHYGCGFPFSRLADLQGNLGIPLPISTQWDELNARASDVYPAFEACSHCAAMGDLFHNDDTPGRVLTLEEDIAKEIEACRENGKKVRTGVFTTGIVAETEGRHIALFFTGRKHAGENLSDLLDKRPENLSTPIQMCDALARNAPKGFKRLLANCLCHGRREFVKLIDDFPRQCRHVLETLRDIYKHDAWTRDQGMSKEDRLVFHQKNSKLIMDEFFEWLNAQLDGKEFEPNSRMGGAIQYMINHWEALTLFLRVPGAPLDNNICERALKTPIRYRNNSLFYKTERGALVGDIFMSLIHTCRLNDVNAFEYLQAIIQYAQQVKKAPGEWLPWNYHEALAQCASP
ncbi:MAG: IS66 family transposase [Tenericutes bacterium]|nr:MAG: IS66 family transposase [Mycoplasmatota bacterium]